ncbi:hypothetical protein BWQ96_02624 [Gracilariopsis chorda]|uniref:Uncharacterized protein n=1 Tax=Gracilariopsis chorda TaxID=448386 RepID=A0A2V3IZZ1_9FLOR|nr:hypothetical protein BWQ96_02624 [Gracilariopsis chorda]|eukprot:PXF47645.1 hypothetical protein BWQ96_02624 [Gracilariopsis chorda]
MIPSPLVPLQLLLLVTRVLAACNQLDPHQCARTCVPFHAGTPKQADFSCGDWWLRANCCNGTDPIPLVTSTYFTCSCETLGMTTRGLVVIVLLAVGALVVVFAAVFYVLYRQKKKVQAEEEERRRAIEEAQVYLPR